jgi:hypothetical protein
VTDAAGQKLAYVDFEEEPGRRAKRSGNLSSGTLERCPERNMPMTALVLLMALSTSVAFALGFVLGWIYQIRGDGFPLPPTARIPQP